MEQMLVTQGLNELKLLDSRITREISEQSFVTAAKTAEKNVIPGITKEKYIADAIAKLQSITDLIDRKTKIKAAIVASNAVTYVKINGVEMTVAAAIEMKVTIDYWISLLHELENQRRSALVTVNKKNADLERTIEGYLTNMFGAEAKNNKDKYLDSITPIREANEYSLVDPIDSEVKIQELKNMIEGFKSEVDAALQISNCITVIEF